MAQLLDALFLPLFAAFCCILLAAVTVAVAAGKHPQQHIKMR